MPIHYNEKTKIRYDEIVKPNVIQERLLALRNAYDLSLDEMSAISENLMTRATLNTWENGVRIPAIDGLQIIAACFGVSIDWLCGMSDCPYTDYSIKIARDLFFNGTEKTISDFTVDEKILSAYPLEVQGNIITLFRYKERYEVKGKKCKMRRYKLKISKLLKAIKEKVPVSKIQKIVKIEYF